MLRVLRLAPWRRAPVLLLRRRSVLLAVLGAATVLSTTAAATPLFLSSVGSAALGRQLRTGCMDESIPYLVSGQFGTIGGGFTLDGARVASVESQVRRAVTGVPGVAPTVETLVASQTVGLATRGREPFQEQLVSRTGFAGHVQVVERAPVRGVYITDDAARFLGGVHAGQPVRLSLEDRTVAVPVAAVYRNLEYQPMQQYWCAEQRLIYPPGYGSDYTPPMVVLADHDLFAQLLRRLGNRAVVTFELPPASPAVTVPEARRIDAAVREQVAPALGNEAQGEVFFGQLVNVRPNLGHLVRRSVATARAVQDAVAPAAVAGALVALLLVGAAGSYWADRRRPEVRLLAARGVGPAAVGVKAALEMGPPTLAGGALGYGAAYLLIRLVGPGATLDGAALRYAAVVAAAAAVAGTALLGLAAAVRARRTGEVPAARHRAARVARVLPWELLALAAAAWSMHRLASGGATRLGVGGIATVNLLVLAFPLLFLAGAVGLAGRVAYFVLATLRRAGRGGSPAWYLAGRRLTAAPHVALVMLVAAALPIGTLVYSAAVTQSVAATLHAKVSTYAGSDVAAETLGDPKLPAALAGRATKVARSEDQSLGPLVGGVSVDVLGVDRGTFRSGAFWVPKLGEGSSLAALLREIAPPPAGGPLPAVLVGVPAGAPDVLRLTDRGVARQVPLRIADRLAAFPGERGRPMVVVDEQALARLTHDVGYAIWARGRPADVLATMRSAGITPIYVVDRDRVLDASSFLSLTWTFGFLEAIALLTGLIAVGGLMLYLESRTRARVASYVLARRMGLRRRAHLGSLAAELGLLLGVGLAVGCSLAVTAAWIVHGRLDVAPDLDPSPLMPAPVPALAGVSAAVLAVVVLGAVGAQLSADRVRPAEVMRFDA